VSAGPRVLVVDDHLEMVKLLADQLSAEAYDVTTASSGEEAVRCLAAERFDLVITDLRMKDVDGFDVLDAAKACTPPVPVLVMTAFGAVDTAVAAMKRGAAHYFTKPFALDEVLIYTRRALEASSLAAENRALRQQAAGAQAPALIGTSAAMHELRRVVERVAQTDATVLVRGESGSGKELVARGIHEASARHRSAFVAVNCSALPANLLESELFGHVRGAFTGATMNRRGLFVEADGGTLFLDEIGDMPLELQARLLRVLQDGTVRPVGSDRAKATDVRVIAATHQDLERRIREGLFRNDLFYRLNVVRVRVPTLRERREDIRLLAEHFLEKARRPGAAAARFSAGALALLEQHGWRGNVRELEAVVERVAVFCGSATVEREHVLSELAPQPATSPLGAVLDLGWSLKQLEDEYIRAVIDACGGNKTRAAEILGIDVSTIHRRERAKDSSDVPRV